MIFTMRMTGNPKSEGGDFRRTESGKTETKCEAVKVVGVK